MSFYRVALRRLSCVLALFVAALVGPSTASAQLLCSSTSPAAQTIKDFATAYNNQDPDTGIALTTPDFVRYSITTPKPMSRQAYYEMWKSFVAAFPDERWEVHSVIACGELVTLSVTERGTFVNPWVMADGYTAQPTGRSYRGDSVIQFEVDPTTNLIKRYLQITTPGFLLVGLTPTDMYHIVNSGY